MLSTSAPTKAQKSRKDRENKERKPSLPQTGRLKTIVRRLPANLPEDVFWQTVQPWVTEETSSWTIYYKGKLRKKLNKENIPSRAYIAFRTEEQLAAFGKAFDGHIFKDKAGVESQAVVEFAPYQKVPSEKKKADNRAATIEKDEDYISFLANLKASENVEPVSLEALIASTQPVPQPKTTPLLEAMKAEKSANKDKEAILRNHAHYSQVNGIVARKDEKKKAPVLAAPQLSPTKPSELAQNGSATPVATGKKGPKKGQVNPPGETPSPQNAKNARSRTPVPSTTPAKPAPNNAVPANPTPKGTKPPRQPRNPPAQPKVVPTNEINSNPQAAVVPPTPLLDSAATPATPTPRRTRPVIGLGSRQFSAALSSVAGLADAATERKKRERERELQNSTAGDAASASATVNGPADVPAVAATHTPVATVPLTIFARIDGSDQEKPGPAPASPKKEKSRRGGGGRSGGGGGHSASADRPIKVPNILQRGDQPKNVIPAPTVSVANGNISVSSSQTLNPSGSSGGGGRGARRGPGGRGGGRGRGIPQQAPRGG